MQSTSTSRNAYCPPGFVDEITRDAQERINGQRAANVEQAHPVRDINRVDFEQQVLNAHEVRQTLTGYFLTPAGEVPWQDEYINRGSYQDV